MYSDEEDDEEIAFLKGALDGVHSPLLGDSDDQGSLTEV